MSSPVKLRVTMGELAKMIDLSLLHPTTTDAQIIEGLQLAKEYGVATACIKPYCIPVAKEILAGSGVGICPVIGFPHGNSTTAIKVIEATAAATEGGNEIDMVINVGKALSGEWDYVSSEIRQINDAVVKHGAILKVIFENDYLQDKHIEKLCGICSEIGVAFVKTSTGYGFVKGADGKYSYAGATMKDLRLMKKLVKPEIQVKAAGGVRTLDDLLRVRALGVTRAGATAAKEILGEAKARGIGSAPVEVTVDVGQQLGGGY